MPSERVIVVGSGPGALAFAHLIPSADIVVRLNVWPWGEPPGAWDVWGIGGGRYIFDWLRDYPPADAAPRDILATIPRARENRELRGNIASLARYCPGAAVTHAGLDRWIEMQQALLVESRAPHWVGPTTGAVAVDMMLQRRPAKLTVIGFDATRDPDKAKWGAWYGNRLYKHAWPSDNHAFDAANRLFDRWLTAREFFGASYPDTEPAWPERDGTWR
jgi:hypothetical protein